MQAMTRKSSVQSPALRFGKAELMLLKRLAGRNRSLVEKRSEMAGQGVLKGWYLDGGQGAQQGKSAVQVDAQVVRAFLAAGVIMPEGAPGRDGRNGTACEDAGRRYRLAPEGRKALKRHLAGGDAGEAQLERRRIAAPPVAAEKEHACQIASDDGASISNLMDINLAESPLGWLARRKDRQGRPLLLPDQIVAGEKLRKDYEFARLTPQFSGGWRMEPSSGSSSPAGSRGGAAELSDQVIAARKRVERVLESMPPVLARLLVDVCCHLKGLETVEAERQWPVRSAKIVLQIGLTALSQAYGLRTYGPESGVVPGRGVPERVRRP